MLDSANPKIKREAHATEFCLIAATPTFIIFLSNPFNSNMVHSIGCQKLHREIYKEECEEIFPRELGITKFTTAHSPPSNIKSIIAQAKLFEVEGKEVS